MPPRPRPQVPARHTPPPAAPPRTRRRKPRSTGGPLRMLGWIMAVVLVLAVSMMLWADAQLNRVQALPDARVANTAGTNWLLVGSDSRQGMSEEDAERLGTGGDLGVGRTDTIMLLHIPNAGQARLVSLPRDSYVTIPGYGDDKINAAFTYGGPQLLTATVENATGLRIDHYAEIGMGGLANVVDAIGGVELCPAEPINDPLAHLDIQAGCQTMDGPTALGYVRTRATPMGDLDRVDRQREFFAALIDEATAANTLLNPLEFFPLVTNTANSFTVGRGDHVWHLARVGLAMRGGVQTETVPVGGFADTAVGNVVLWEPGGAQALWESMR
ncbi:MAG TPA: LCP family protein [Corynebacterium sp.]|nr:LCP family protein [Corynebacterium sp.]